MRAFQEIAGRLRRSAFPFASSPDPEGTAHARRYRGDDIVEVRQLAPEPPLPADTGGSYALPPFLGPPTRLPPRAPRPLTPRPSRASPSRSAQGDVGWPRATASAAWPSRPGPMRVPPSGTTPSRPFSEDGTSHTGAPLCSPRRLREATRRCASSPKAPPGRQRL